MYLGGGSGRRAWEVHSPTRTAIGRSTNRYSMNRDTLYSSAVFDLDAGPVTVWLPGAGSGSDHHGPQPGPLRAYGGIRRGHIHGDQGEAYAPRSLPCGRLSTRKQRRHEASARLQNAIKVDQPGGPGSLKRPTGTQRARRRCATRS